MINGIYQSASGLESLTRVQETLANNLANVASTGFKQAVADCEQNSDGRILTRIRIDSQAGPLQITDNPTQLALGGDGYFVLETPQGTVFTRNGDFHLDAGGRLVSAEGYPVQGEKGEIVLADSEFTVTPAGEIVVQGEVQDRLRLIRGAESLQAAGAGVFKGAPGAEFEEVPAGQGRVLQGALEGSNVNLLRGMVDLLAVVRQYEANQKAVESQDETINQMITQVGKTA